MKNEKGVYNLNYANQIYYHFPTNLLIRSNVNTDKKC